MLDKLNKNLMLASLFVVPVILSFRLDPFFPVLVADQTAKIFVALMFAGMIALNTFYSGAIKPIKDRALMALILFCIANIFVAPNFIVKYAGQNIGGFWIYEDLFYMLIYFMLLVAVASYNYCSVEIDRIFRWISRTAMFICGYLALQALGLDQIQSTGDPIIVGHMGDSFYHPVAQANLTSTMGQPTILAAWLAMILPILYYRKRSVQTAIVILALIITRSDVANGAAVIATIFYMMFTFPKAARIAKWIFGVLVVTLVLLVWVGLQDNPDFVRKHVHDSGRFQRWEQILRDLRSSPYGADSDRMFCYFGRGIGSYQYTFVQDHELDKEFRYRFFQAHNEYLEMLYNGGLFGAGLLIFGILSLIWRCCQNIIHERRYLALLSSFLAICLCAAGTLVWQIEPHRYYTIIIAGLLFSGLRNKTINQTEVEKCSNN